MTWFKVDDSFYDHPKVFDAPDCAVALWTRAGTWSARNLTDGFVPTGMPARLCDDPERAVRELINRGLWSRSKGGYQFHDWSEYQPTRDEAMASAAKMSSGGSLGNHRRWHAGKGKVDPRCRYCQDKRDRPTDRPPDRVPDTPPDSGASPPVPSRPEPSSGNGSYVAQGRNAREPDRAPPSDEPPSRVELLITEYRDNSPRGLPSRQAEKLAAEIHLLIGDGYTDLEIRAGLGQLRVRKLGPGMLAALVDELANQAPPSNVVALRADARPRTGGLDQKVNDHLELSRQLAAEEAQ